MKSRYRLNRSLLKKLDESKRRNDTWTSPYMSLMEKSDEKEKDTGSGERGGQRTTGSVLQHQSFGTGQCISTRISWLVMKFCASKQMYCDIESSAHQPSFKERSQSCSLNSLIN